MLQDTENPWKIFAEQIGAKYHLSEEGTSRVTGSYRGYVFELKIIFIQAAPKVNLFLTHFELELKQPTDLRLKIYREGILQKLTKLFGTRDIILNDRYFDKKFIVEGSHEDYIKQMLSPDIRATISELGELLMILDGTKLIYEQSGKIIDLNKLYKILDLLVTLATKLE
ncbi:MAG TPA: hypothetical protein ENN22_06700 [bacterium]|nr:hypothetical protein [bacterium]